MLRQYLRLRENRCHWLGWWIWLYSVTKKYTVTLTETLTRRVEGADSCRYLPLPHPVHHRHMFPHELPRPKLGRLQIWVLRCQPVPELEQVHMDVVAALSVECSDQRSHQECH